jgi:hypothetical protein
MYKELAMKDRVILMRRLNKLLDYISKNIDDDKDYVQAVEEEAELIAKELGFEQ